MSESFLKAPASESVRLISFDEAKVVPGFIPETWILIVSGTKPCINMEVKLIPRIYVKQPEYWGIEVTGILPGGICLTATAPYSVALPLDSVLGTKGIEVIGANKKEQIAVPPSTYSPKTSETEK
ncbi:MAG TPA: hypothetical protein VGQ76_04505 [Thermoanaerobaculia bacterium]|jgi:hypothetical protein|nr:hypothetical protein [Thermoanaerobaculia bacterium]